MRKMIIFGLYSLILILFCACVVTKPSGTVNLFVQSPQGEPIAEVYVYAEKHLDGSDIFPGPLLGVTDENGILEYTPEEYGIQNLTFLKYGYTVEGEERRKTEETVPYGEVAVEITRKDVKENRAIPVRVPSVSFE